MKLAKKYRESEKTMQALERAVEDLRKFSSSFSEGIATGKNVGSE